MNRIGIILADRYELTEELGSGGMADVYKASDRKLNRNVAVKILRQEFSTDENFIARFKQEAMAAASIQTPYVVNVYDVGEENGINYIVMELAEGMTLKEYIQKKGKLEIVEAINIAMQIVMGIREAHMHGIIHRDIKPQNIMVSSDGKIKVMDFGIAKAVTAQTITANAVGSVHYISPEQARGSACDERCDLYSISIVMYEMITGRVPFDGDSTVAIALAHIKEPITPPSVYEPMIPVSLEKIIMKCAQKKPELRYSSADELIDDLKKALMTPEEDFVKEVVVNTEGGTRVFTDEETKKIKEETKTVAVKTQEEEDYQLGLENEQEEELTEEENDSKIEKMVLGIGIGALVIVVIIAALLISHAFNLKTPFGNDKETASETSILAENQTRMPDLEGKTLEEAQALLNKASLGIKTEQKASDDVKKGYIISAAVVNEDGDASAVNAGDILEKHTQVTVYVSSGKEVVPIPSSIIGATEEEATRILTEAGLLVNPEEGLSNDVEEGQVYKCSPGVGEDVAKGETITIYVCTGPDVEEVKVPNLVGRTSDVAKLMLETAGLKGNPTTEYSETIQAGEVIRQDPEGGDKVEEGSTVNYVVSLGKEGVSVPNLQNKTQSEAEQALKDAGLEVGEISTSYNNTISEGRVISQSIIDGTSVSKGTKVNLVISLGPEDTSVKVPSIIGLSESAALSRLHAEGLNGSCLGTEPSSEPAGTVIRLDITEESSVEKGSTIGYYLSAGEGDTNE